MEKEVFKIPFVAHEAAIYQYESIVKKLIVALVLTNVIDAIVVCLIRFSKKG